MLGKTSKNMKELLRDVCRVKEEHLMIYLFLDGDVLLDDIMKQCKEILKIQMITFSVRSRSSLLQTIPQTLDPKTMKLRRMNHFRIILSMKTAISN